MRPRQGYERTQECQKWRLLLQTVPPVLADGVAPAFILQLVAVNHVPKEDGQTAIHLRIGRTSVHVRRGTQDRQDQDGTEEVITLIRAHSRLLQQPVYTHQNNARLLASNQNW